jgi:prevent-host-death family protein
MTPVGERAVSSTNRRHRADEWLTNASNPVNFDQSIQLTDPPMREIQASEAKTHLPQILDDVERGETVIITRHGRAIARIVPEAQRRQAEIDRAIDGIKALRRQTGKITVHELLSARHEGHRY